MLSPHQVIVTFENSKTPNMFYQQRFLLWIKLPCLAIIPETCYTAVKFGWCGTKKLRTHSYPTKIMQFSKS